jgi:hypothetical protein
MSKLILFLLLSLGALPFVNAQKLVSKNNPDLSFLPENASQLREVVSLINFKGTADYQGFVFSRSGRFFDQITIQRKDKQNLITHNASFKSLEVAESDLLAFITYLEIKKEAHQTSQYTFAIASSF